jgi:hypothetical protein
MTVNAKFTPQENVLPNSPNHWYRFPAIKQISNILFSSSTHIPFLRHLTRKSLPCVKRPKY